ncbi:cell division/cell wall cluster transcriptional repressor MraZ [Candidatus Kaiserbacteria bacterium RIFCSPHIGHO2_02_FULL_50_50]|uniref:Transcriptional regulator MraZ n=1 Tax=Candidatus Kaiserbacteria bacterium RIFCSPHIGHO2_02_FULL_50_50 TaxID=1798492 RepID=A0A1F6DCK7_9BACT|nr:MAG: cell division/cell wall cluster transcriptional repressor MraZ [Candidatus Kaiserbacteria bacterium RIFCSPHIGHO2_02_FULL_50_50]OGG89010.1 MAG: cell division/cell wall cluster transcriptional repressor MraZ [Candidatus Kaiserbacteria bacterium RIFCSPLOWO2_12_FULL_50_10]
MLIGEYSHTIDIKNRVSLPAKWRQELGKSVVITRGLEGCLTVYTLAEWEKVSAMFTNSPFASADERGFARYMLSAAAEVDVDSAGRVLVPDVLKTFAKFDKTVVLAGVHNRVEVWDEAHWRDYSAGIETNAAEMAEKIVSRA